MDIEALYLFNKLLLLMFSLVVIGEPLRVILSKCTGLFSELDHLQICVINVYLGGLILYTVAMIPLHLFAAPVVWWILATCGTLSALLHAKTLRSSLRNSKTIKDCMLKHKGVVLKNALVALMFFSLLWIEVLPLSSFVYGNVHDSALFGLFVELNLINQQTPVIMQPYGTEGIIYPQGFFVIEAFACHLLGFSAAEVTLRVTPLFMALSVLGAYYLGKALSPKSHLDISMAFTFWCISRWPRLLIWGSNAFVAGFPLYFVALTFLPQLKNLRKPRRNMLKIMAIGILFGYLAAIHLVFFELLFVIVVLTTFLGILRERKRNNRRFINFLVFCVFSIIPISMSVYRFILWYPYPGHNIGLPSDIVLQAEDLTGGVPPATVLETLYEWIVVSDWINPNPLIKCMIVGLFIIGTVVTIMLREDECFSHMKRIITVALSASAVAGLMIILVRMEASVLFPFIFSLMVQMIQVAETTILVLTSFFAMIGIYNIMFFRGFQRLWILASRLHNNKVSRKSVNSLLRNKRTKKEKTAILKVAAISTLIFTAVYAPFVYCLFTHDLEYARGQYNMFCVTTKSDNQLMLWMKNNLPRSAVILINPWDAGGFIPTVSNHRVIYQPGASRYSHSYEELVGFIDNHNLNTTTYAVMKQSNISHMFIGSSALFGHHSWDPLLFLGNPNFKLLKNIGASYLFGVNVKDPDTHLIFMDNFECCDLNITGWKMGTSPSEGFGYANITTERSYDGVASVKISAKSLDEGFWYSIYRKIYVPITSNVVLSFYVDAANGFDAMDTFMVIVSDLSWTRQLFFAAIPNRADTSVVVLPMLQGYFQFDISGLWQEIHNSTLPTSFYLQAFNYDTDGIENVAYIDLIRIEIQAHAAD
jgi:hypothetical protein